MVNKLQITAIAMLMLFVMLIGEAFSQQIIFNELHPQDGGDFNFVTGITQDLNGIMWFSTKQGLYKYNGNQMTNYQYSPFNPNSVMSNFLESVYADFDGQIWIGSLGKGMDRFDPETGKFTHFQHDPENPASLSSDTVTCILRDQQGILWIGTHGGLDQYDPKTNSFTHFRHKENDLSTISFNQVRVMYEDKQGILWIGTGSPYPDNGGRPEDGGLNRMNKSTGTFTRYLHDDNNNSIISNKVSTIYEDFEGNFWIGTGKNGLHKMNREKGTFERLEFDPAHPDKFSAPAVTENTPIYEHITFINQDATGNYWLGTTEDGLYFFNPELRKMIHYKKTEDSNSEFNDNGVWTAFNSRDGILWIGGTTQGNVYRINPIKREFPFFKTSEGINGFYQGPSGELWLGGDSSLLILNENTGIQKRLINDLNPLINNDWIQFIKEDMHGDLWIGGGNGLNLWDKENKKFIQYFHDPLNNNTLSDNRILSFYEDNNINLWLGTVNGLTNFNRETGIFSRYYFRLDDTIRIGNNVISAVNKDKEGRFWVGLENGGGVYLFNPETKKNKSYLKGSNIVCIYQDSNDILWVGSGDGLFRYNQENDNFLRYSDPALMSGIPNVLTIVEDNQQYLWISSYNNGLIRINPARNQSSKFGRNYGVNLNGFYWNSGYKDRIGKLYFGSSTGYYVIDPEELLRNQNPPEIVFSGFRLADQPVVPGNSGPLKESISKTNEISLQFYQNVFSFDFSIVDYADPDQNQLVYYLENYDKNWVQSNTEGRAYYFNIPPGKYIFHVKGANSYSDWSEKTISIIIMPPWWKTWWAYVIYALLFVVAVFGVDRFQRHRLLQAEKEKNRERELAHAKEIEKAYTELKTTQSQLIQSEKMASLGELTAGIAHEIQNPLNFVNNFSEVNSELIDELTDEVDNGNLEEVKAIAKDIKENEQKINHHGKRADAIVKGMLQHSRISSGVKEPTDINELADEYLRLAYHGLRAKDKSFNAKMNTDFDESIGKINVIPQDIGRVILNLITNAFYAVAEKKKQIEEGYEPTVSVMTRKLFGKVEISVSDNANGIPPKVLDKIFQPFFTTKPTGQGTGLGLSLSYDIIKAHGGELTVETKEGEGSEFIIQIPIN